MSSTSDPILLFLSQIERLNEAQGNTAPEEQIARYAQELIRSGITLDQLTFAVDELVLTLKYFPKIPEIMEVISHAAIGDVVLADAIAWVKKMRRELQYRTEEEYNAKPVATRGPRPSVARPPTPNEFPDPVTRETCRILSWDRLVDFDFEDPFRMNEFSKAFEQAMRTVDREVRAGRVSALTSAIRKGNVVLDGDRLKQPMPLDAGEVVR